MTTELIGAKGHWSSTLLGLRPPGSPDASLSVAIGVAEADRGRVQRVILVVTHPADVAAWVQVADEHLPVETLLRADLPARLPGTSLDLAVNVVVVGEGTFPVAYRVYLISAGGAPC